MNRVEGSWSLVDGQSQFVAVVGFDKGEVLVEADQPLPQGGGGNRPGPVQYCLFGLASCFAATYASNAAMMGVELKKLRVAAEADVNFSRTFGLSDEPIIEEVRITVDVDSDAPQEELRRVEEMAAQRCPGAAEDHPAPGGNGGRGRDRPPPGERSPGRGQRGSGHTTGMSGRTQRNLRAHHCVRAW
ncbi:MAG: hypothetical protein A2Z17_04475 [Gammaproteobacteria bacterium RBG_16_66_13]|nr:MAG: hypothetical protein A2Z17_04475 [Gammaproteobacteria bacterium RBG_16_66_13]